MQLMVRKLKHVSAQTIRGLRHKKVTVIGKIYLSREIYTARLVTQWMHA